MPSGRTWFITGCSSGLGLALASAVLARGERAVITARRPEALAELARAHGERCLALRLDVTVPADVQAAVSSAQARFGGIDVLVNNAGQGFVASIEDADEAAVRALFELNFFGPLLLVRAALPGMRARGRGHVVNISSTSGVIGRAGSGFYNASKFALEGLSEALVQEVAPFGLKVTIVEPSGFRTRFVAARHEGAVGAYQGTVGERLQEVRRPGFQPPGDPERAAAAIIEIVDAPQPPLRLPLGAGAVAALRSKIALLQRDLEAGEAVALQADAPPAAPAS